MKTEDNSRAHKHPSLVPMLTQMYPVHTLPSYFFNVFLISTSIYA
jgi:hypothetical protein